MYRAITFIEIVISLAISVIALYFISPIIFRLQDPVLLTREVDQIKSFIYQIQTQARYFKQRYSVSISQNANRWCMVAIAKKSTKETACNCLNLSSCAINSSYYLYQPISSSIKLKSNSLYPKVFMNIDGVAGRLETICLGLTLNQSQQILQFDSNGVINVAQQGKRTKCR